jgi:hypothetical protein
MKRNATRKTRYNWEDNIKIDLTEIKFGGVD